jgi:ceramide glucosyltransferase
VWRAERRPVHASAADNQMGETLAAWLGVGFAVLAIIGTALVVPAAMAVQRLAARRPKSGPALAASVLKPLHGASPDLQESLASTLAQDHAAPFEVIFVVRDADDPAVWIAEAAMAAHPHVPARLVRDQRLHGANLKVSQLLNVEELAQHPVIVVADADMRVGPDWLSSATAPLADPTTGITTCLYRAAAADGRFWSRLAVLGTDWHFLPNAAFGETLGLAHGCYGATMALRREVLERIGGFAPLADLLADDHALGAEVRRLGLRVVVAPALPTHMAHEIGAKALLAHELRWARTLRMLAPSGYLGSGLTHPLAWGLLAAALAPRGWGVVALAVAALGRVGLATAVDIVLNAPGRVRRLALLPMRDLLSFAIWAVGLARSPVVWSGRRYRLRRDGSMAELRPGE